MAVPLMSLERFNLEHPNANLNVVIRVKLLTQEEIAKYNVKPLFGPSNNLIPNTMNGKDIQNNEAINISHRNENIPISSNNDVPNTTIKQKF